MASKKVKVMGAFVDSLNESRLSKEAMIELCVRKGQWDLARSALSLPGDCRASGSKGSAWLSEAVDSSRRLGGARSEALAFTKDLLALGADPLAPSAPVSSQGFNSRDVLSPLGRALRSKEFALAKAMAEAPGLDKAKALAQIEREGLGVREACALGERAIELMLFLGKSPNAQSEVGTPWSHFCASAVALKLLIEAGANPRALDKAGVSLEEKAARVEDSKERPAMMSLLAVAVKKEGDAAEAEEVKSQTRAIFALASRGSKTELLQAIKARGMSAKTIQDEFGRSLLARALASGNWGVVKGLLAMGLDPMREAPSGEPEACYLFLHKAPPRSGSAGSRQRLEAAEALVKKIAWGWRSASGRSLIEEWALNPGAAEYCAKIKGGAAPAVSRCDRDFGAWFVMKEPQRAEAPLSVALLKTPGLEFLGARAVASRLQEPFEAPSGESALDLMSAFFFKSIVKSREFERGSARKLAKDICAWSGLGAEKEPGEPPARAPARPGAMEVAIAAMAQARSASAEIAYSAEGELSQAFSEFVEAGLQAGWRPDFNRLSPAVMALLSKKTEGFGRSAFFESGLSDLFKRGGPESSSMILDAVMVGSEWSLRLARQWMDELDRSAHAAFPSSHPAFRGQLPESVANSELWREIERWALASQAQAPGRAGPALRI